MAYRLIPLRLGLRWLAFVAAVLTSPAALGAKNPSASACPQDVATLLRPFQKLVGFQVDFVEEKFIALLTKPLINRGRIFFMAPDSLVRQVNAPVPGAVWLRQGQLWVRDGHGERKLDVGAWGPANVLMNSFLYVLRGDVENLNKHFALQLSCESAQWSLQLVPKDAALLKLLKHLRIQGRNDAPEVLEMLDGAGDRSVTRFSKEDRSVRLSDAQMKAAFTAKPAQP